MAAEGDIAKPAKPQASSIFRHGMLVSFKEITYSVRNAQNTKESIDLLTRVSGYLRPGEMVALMGPSGCGKTTLLDVLAGRKTVGSIQGEILFGGVKPSKMFLRRYTGYVEQFDTLVPILTVEEMLQYTAELKYERTTPAAKKAAAVERVIESLGLSTCRKVMIGSNLQKGISGGQSKRVNIGIALISAPSVLFLDEPTTGLDSFTANEVMAVVKSLAATGVTVCATIHSPTQHCFNLFDRLLLLLRGRVVYFGRNGTQVKDYLTSGRLSLDSTVEASTSSMAEWITDITVCADRGGRGLALADAFATSDLKAHADVELETQLRQTVDLPPETAAALAVTRETTTPMWFAYLVLLRFRLSKTYRMGDFYGSHIAPLAVQSLIMMSTFWQVGANVTPLTVTNVMGIIFFWGAAPAFAAASYIPAIFLARPLYFRERNDGLYKPVTFLAYLMTEEVLILIPVTLLANMVMWFGLGMAGSFVLWWLSFFITYTMGIAIAYFITAMSPTMDVANAAVPIYGVFCLFFSGFLVRITSVGWWWRWYFYCSPTYWSVAAQINNFFAGDRNLVWVANQTVPEYYSVTYLPAWGFLGMQCIFPCVFLTLAWLALKYKTVIKR